MQFLSIVALLVSGLIHLIPVTGAIGASRLFQLYGIEVVDPNLAILLQHRALLFGILGALMLIAIPIKSLRFTAITIGFLSASSFVCIATLVGNYNDAVHRVVIADVIVSVLLTLGFFAELRYRKLKSTGPAPSARDHAMSPRS
jgi:hypothetical protein